MKKLVTTQKKGKLGKWDNPNLHQPIKHSQIFKIRIYTVSQYIKKFKLGVSNQAIGYAMDKGLLDYVKIGRDRFVVMTKLTKTYVPSNSGRRAVMSVAV